MHKIHTVNIILICTLCPDVVFVFYSVFQEKKKRSAEELIEMQESVKTLRDKIVEVRSLNTSHLLFIV